MKNMAKNIDIEGNVTNHSARKTMAERLISKGVDTKFVKDLGGQKNINSLDSYATASVEQQHLMSSLLQANESPSLDEPTPSTSTSVCENSEIIVAEEKRTVVTFETLGLDGYGKFCNTQIYTSKFEARKKGFNW